MIEISAIVKLDFMFCGHTAPWLLASYLEWVRFSKSASGQSPRLANFLRWMHEHGFNDVSQEAVDLWLKDAFSKSKGYGSTLASYAKKFTEWLVLRGYTSQMPSFKYKPLEETRERQHTNRDKKTKPSVNDNFGDSLLTKVTDYYRFLEIDQQATDCEIKNAYRKAAFKLHPDHNPGDSLACERFVALGKIYATLSDPTERQDYDKTMGFVKSGFRPYPKKHYAVFF